MRILPALLLLCITATLSAQTLRYDIAFEKAQTAGKMKLDVTLEFYPSPTGTSRFVLPEQINWSGNLLDCYRKFDVQGGTFRREGNTVLLFTAKDQKGPVQLHYELIQHFSGEQVTVETSCSPIILADYMHVPGECLFLVPRHYHLYDVSVHWKDLPKGWTIQNSFNSGQIEQEFKSSNTDWLRANWVAGDFRILHGEVEGKPIAFAIRGKWVFEDRTLFEVIRKTIATQRSTWDDFDIPFYSVTMIPFVLPTGQRIVGRARTGQCLGYGSFQSFIVFASDDCPLDPLINLFNHEMMHDWIGGKIDVGPANASTSLRWLAEGFTEYYALRNRWKAGFITTPAFLKELNDDFFAAHYADPCGEMPNLELERNYFSSETCENLPYRRGCLLAFYLDARIRKQTGNTKTLHNLMTELLDYTYGNDRTLVEHYEFLTETLGEYLGDETMAFLAQYVDAGKRIPAKAYVLPEFLSLRVTPAGVPLLAIAAGREADFKK
ncbi:MAG: hypothetical protein ABIQ93_17010 [Saprospiraceae bacterium]